MKTLSRLGWPAMLLASALVWAGCTTLYTGAVTLTKAVEAAARDYAKIYNDGLVPPDVAVKVSAAHTQYRKAAGIAAEALEVGNETDRKATLEAARTAALGFVDLLVELLPKPRVTELRARIKEAQAP